MKIFASEVIFSCDIEQYLANHLASAKLLGKKVEDVEFIEFARSKVRERC